MVLTKIFGFLELGPDLSSQWGIFKMGDVSPDFFWILEISKWWV